MIALLLLLPFLFIKFWLFDAPRAQVIYFLSLNRAFMHFFSLPLLIKTFFKPWKNEYREGLVGFSIGMGMFVKSIFITVDIVLLCLLLVFELLFLSAFVAWPIVAVSLFFV